MYEMRRGPSNPRTLREGWENLGPSQSRTQPLQEVCSQVPRTLQLSQIAEGLVGGKEPVLGRIPQAGLERGQGRPWASIKHLTQGPPATPSSGLPSGWELLVCSNETTHFPSPYSCCHSVPLICGPQAPLSLPQCSCVGSLWVPCPFLLFSWCSLLQFLSHLWLPPFHYSPIRVNSADLLGDQFLLQDPHRTPYSDSTVTLLYHMLHALFKWHYVLYLWYYYGSAKDLQLIHYC